MADTLHTIYLHGSLGKKYGTGKFSIYGSSIKDVICGLSSNLDPSFKQTIREGEWHITKGKQSQNSDLPDNNDTFVSNEEVELSTNTQEIHIYPKVKGAGGVWRVVLGVVLIIVGILLVAYAGGAGADYAFTAGAGLIIGGIASLLTKSPKLGGYESAEVDQRPSFLFNGIVNVVEQGGPVPVVCGRHRTGSTVIGASMEVVQL